MAFTAKDVVTLREMTNAGMMDCKKALTENNGNMDAAVKWLREKGIAQAAKRADRAASQGAVTSYIHMGGKIGVLLEVNCETDFVARTDQFQALCKDLCLQVCSANPKWVTREEADPKLVAAEKEIYITRARATGKPENMLDKIADGMLNKWYKEVCLMEQGFVKEPDRTIEDLVKELSGRLGEKLEVRRFARFQLGESLEGSSSSDEASADEAAPEGN